MCVEGRGRISRSGLTQDIKMGSCAFQCDVPHQWIAQRQVGPVSVYCDVVGCHVLCLQHGISVWQHIGQSTTATNRHRRYENEIFVCLHLHSWVPIRYRCSRRRNGSEESFTSLCTKTERKQQRYFIVVVKSYVA